MEGLTACLLTTPTLHSPQLVQRWSKVLHSIVTSQRPQKQLQQTILSSDTSNELIALILKVLLKCLDQTEPLYALSSLVRYSDRVRPHPFNLLA